MISTLQSDVLIVGFFNCISLCVSKMCYTSKYHQLCNEEINILIVKTQASRCRFHATSSILVIIDSSLQWRHKERDFVSNHHRLDCLLNHFFKCRSKNTSKLRVTGLYEGNSPLTGEFPSQWASNAENVSIWWRHPDETWLPLLTDTKTLLERMLTWHRRKPHAHVGMDYHKICLGEIIILDSISFWFFFECAVTLLQVYLFVLSSDEIICVFSNTYLFIGRKLHLRCLEI